MKKTQFLLVFMVTSMCLLFVNTCQTSRLNKLPGLVDTLYTSQNGAGLTIELVFEKGKEHNFPLMTAWVTDTLNTYLQTLYVSESIAKGIFKHGETSSGKWLPGERRRPAALPVWSHNRGVKEADGLYVPTLKTSIPDAYTGATPLNNFVLFSKLEYNSINVFDIYFEINQTWDWNEYWTNNKYPDNEEYKTSCQPSLVYYTRINTKDEQKEYDLKLIGHGHYSGADGIIYPDLNTFTTALDITRRVYVIIK